MGWLLKKDKKSLLQFASLQGETAKRILGQDIKIDTIIYFRDDQKLEKSTAILIILSDLNILGALTKLSLLILAFIRDGLYDLVAKLRCSIAGKKQSCRIPTAEEKQRILD